MLQNVRSYLWRKILEIVKCSVTYCIGYFYRQLIHKWHNQKVDTEWIPEFPVIRLRVFRG